jgi:hypothetical protein
LISKAPGWLKWQDFDLTFFNAYMDALDSRPDLMQDYLAKLAENDAMKNALSP